MLRSEVKAKHMESHVKNGSTPTDEKLVFLHVPKTGGQSVRQMLHDAYGEAAICPARSTEELCTYSMAQLSEYRVHAPHGDWSTLDAVSGPKKVFTVLRDPLDRILSYYFYVADKAEKMSAQELALPHHQGLNAVHSMSPDEYFFEGPPHLRAFIADNYDNFYAYYFGTRRMDGRRRLNNLMQRGLHDIDRVVDAALSNIDALDGVYTLDELPLIQQYIAKTSETPLKGAYHVNKNGLSVPADRLDKLRARGASQAVIDLLYSYAEHDRKIWDAVCAKRKSMS